MPDPQPDPTYYAQFTAEELQTATGGQWLSPPQLHNQTVRLWTDTRTLDTGDFFVALRGERFDGHGYLEQALNSGAVGALVAKSVVESNPERFKSLPNLLMVDEPVWSYLAVAGYHRQRVGCQVIALTGSSGKTTVKDMLYTAISPWRKTHKTQKNFNNEVGVSQTLLAMPPDTEVAIVEMGMRGLNQIRPLTLATQPDVALITNVGPAHIGILGSLEAIAEAKCEILEGLKPSGVAVLNGDNPYLMNRYPHHWTDAVHFFKREQAVGLEQTEAGLSFQYQDLPVQLPLVGDFQAMNALSVLAAGQHVGLSVQQLIHGLSQYTGTQGRGDVQEIPQASQIQVINDAYNANPSSMEAALSGFVALSKTRYKGYRRVLLLGAMNELGETSERYHRQLGQWLVEHPMDAVLTVGQDTQWVVDEAKKQGYTGLMAKCDSVEDCVAQLHRWFDTPWPNTVVYLKGSRSYGLDGFVNAWQIHQPSQDSETVGGEVSTPS